MRCLTLSRICARWFTLLLLALTTPVVCLAASVDPALAAQWREQARALEHGEGVARNVEEAVALYCKAALAHDAQAHYSLGWIYANGRGVPRNDAFAAYLFKQAAELGDQPVRSQYEDFMRHVYTTAWPRATAPAPARAACSATRCAST
jgi:TPR repeat protein